jgi:hypothetical protein
MEDEEKGAKNPKRNERPATPLPSVDIALTMFAHDGFTLQHDEKAQIGPVWPFIYELPIARAGVSRHACPGLENESG